MDMIHIFGQPVINDIRICVNVVYSNVVEPGNVKNIFEDHKNEQTNKELTQISGWSFQY